MSSLRLAILLVLACVGHAHDYLAIPVNPTVNPAAPPPTRRPPTSRPTRSPTEDAPPTANPTRRPTRDPTDKPTSSPTRGPPPTANPTRRPTSDPTDKPTSSPTRGPPPTANPTRRPTRDPTEKPTSSPTRAPPPTTTNPTRLPTSEPTETPTLRPTRAPTKSPTADPTKNPTKNPTAAPTSSPTTPANEYAPTKLDFPVPTTPAPTSNTDTPTDDTGNSTLPVQRFETTDVEIKIGGIIPPLTTTALGVIELATSDSIADSVLDVLGEDHVENLEVDVKIVSLGRRKLRRLEEQTFLLNIVISIQSLIKTHDVNRYIYGALNNQAEQRLFLDTLRASNEPSLAQVDSVVVTDMGSAQDGSETPDQGTGAGDGDDGGNNVVAIVVPIVVVLIASIAGFILYKRLKKEGKDSVAPVKTQESSDHRRIDEIEVSSVDAPSSLGASDNLSYDDYGNYYRTSSLLGAPPVDEEPADDKDITASDQDVISEIEDSFGTDPSSLENSFPANARFAKLGGSVEPDDSILDYRFDNEHVGKARSSKLNESSQVVEDDSLLSYPYLENSRSPKVDEPKLDEDDSLLKYAYDEKYGSAVSSPEIVKPTLVEEDDSLLDYAYDKEYNGSAHSSEVDTPAVVDEADSLLDYDYDKEYNGNVRAKAAQTEDDSILDYAYDNEYNGNARSPSKKQTKKQESLPLPSSAKENDRTVDIVCFLEDIPVRFVVTVPSGALGLVLESSEEGIPEVQLVKKSSPVVDKVEAGDLLVSVDGKDVSLMPATHAQRLIDLKKNRPERRLEFARPQEKEYEA